jgi:hypothetical protein
MTPPPSPSASSASSGPETPTPDNGPFSFAVRRSHRRRACSGSDAEPSARRVHLNGGRD